MGQRWYLHNETLDRYYATGCSSVYNVQIHIKEVLSKHGWSLDHKMRYVSDYDEEINFDKVVNY